MTLQQWQSIMTESISTVLTGLVESIPLIVGALITILVFWIIAKVVRTIIVKVLTKLNIDALMAKANLDVMFDKAGVKVSVAEVLGQFAYLLLMLIGLVAATQTMGWDTVSLEIAKLIALIPKILTGLVIFIIGFYIAGIIRDVITGATESLGVGAGKILASVIYYFLLIIITLSTLEHIGMDISLLSDNVQLIVAAVVIAGAISYGLASRHLLQNTLSTYYGKGTFEVGQRIRVDGLTGEIIDISNISVILRTETGKTVIPSSSLTNSKVEILD